MKGKIVNLCMSAMNILMGIFILIFTLNVEQDKTLLTVQEQLVIGRILIAMYIIMAIVVLIDLYQWFNHRKDIEFNIAFFIGIFVVIFLLIKSPLIAIIPILSGILILIKSLKENLVEIDSTLGISIMAVIMAGMVITSMVTFFYKDIASDIKEKEDKGLLKYTSDYFKYITELDIEEPYINVKKEGKYGYMNPRGEMVIDFEYDYASPFIKIFMYNKEFYIALVCKDGTSSIILKNKREVMSYRSESSDDNYDAKIKELSDIYTNTLGQPGEIEYEIKNVKNNINKVPVYRELSSDYTYRYDYSDQYDVIVSKSNLGSGDTYELAKKEDISQRMVLECGKLDYDENYLYLFSNNYIPFYYDGDTKQGWFNTSGVRMQMDGRAQILDFVDDKILIRDYSSGEPAIYFINEDRIQISNKYKSICVLEDGYLVEDSNGKHQVLDKSFNKVLDLNYDYIDTTLISCGIYICMDTSKGIDFNDYSYAKMKIDILDKYGNPMGDNIEQIYSDYYKISNDKSESYAKRYNDFLQQIKTIDYSFVGDKFYARYLRK